MFIALIWKFYFSPFMVLIIAILNDGTIMAISKDKVKPSPTPDSWKLKEIFATRVVLGGYQALMTDCFRGSEHEMIFCFEPDALEADMGNDTEVDGVPGKQFGGCLVSQLTLCL